MVSFPFPNRMKGHPMCKPIDIDDTGIVPIVRHRNGSVDYGTPRRADDATTEERDGASLVGLRCRARPAVHSEPKKPSLRWALWMAIALYVAAFAALAWRATGVL